nr:OB-fold domain-containing protein [Bordetella sp. N]
MAADAAPVGGADAEYQKHLAQGEFRIQRCAACHEHVFYPRMLCPHCGSARLDWTRASGDGVVYACSVVKGKPGTGTDYNIVLVDLAEGVRMMSRVQDCPNDAVTIGMAVRARIIEQDGKPLVVFAPAAAQLAQGDKQ